MAGKWYLVGFATNAQWFVNHKAGMKMGTAMLAPTAGEDLDISYANLKWVINMQLYLKKKNQRILVILLYNKW